MAQIKETFARFRKMPAFTGLVLFLFAVLLNMALQGPGRFFSLQAINTLFFTNMAFLLVVMGQSILLISGTLDLSIGVQMTLVNVVTIMTVQEWGIPFGLGCLLGIAAAMIVSLILWLCVSILRLPDLLASFAMIYAVRGVNVLIMPVPQGNVDRIYWSTYASRLFDVIPMSAFVLIFVLLFWAYLRRTRFGTNIYAVGANPQHAFAAGISPAKVQLQAFMFKGFLVGLAGLCLTLMTGSGNPVQGEDIGLRSLAACIIGGLTFGGWGTPAAGIFGAGFFILVQNSVYFLFGLLGNWIPGFTASTYWQTLITDIIIFLGLLMTIVTMKGQREALRISIQSKYSFLRREKDGDAS